MPATPRSTVLALGAPLRARRLPALIFIVAAAGAAGSAAGADAGVRLVQPAIDPPPRPVFPVERLREILEPLAGGRCDPGAIVATLARRYRFLGYVPSIEAACDAGGAPSVTLRESSHVVALVTFEPADLGAIDARADPAFAEGRGPYPVPVDAPRAALRALVTTRPGDLHNHERYRADRNALLRLGYTIAFVAGSPDRAGYPRCAYLIQSLRPRPRQEETIGRTNYLGGSASYGPRRKGAVGVVYQKDALLGPLDRLTVAPLYNAAVGGELTYTAPLLARREAPRRLYDAEAGVFSDFRHNRLLRGIETDQRTTGAAAVLGIRPAGQRSGRDMRFEAGLRHERFSLEEEIPGEPEERLSVLRLGASFDWRHTYRWPGFSLHVAPAVDFALDTIGGERTFTRGGVDASLHTRHLPGIETDVRLLAGTLDRDVPSFEAWSLGGAATVRGFREDFRTGRHVAALQAEIWIPFVRPLAERPEVGDAVLDDPGALPLEPPAARLLKWALFADAGYVSGTTDGVNEAIAGAGVGLRFIVPGRPIVVRVDYAWGLGRAGDESFPYVSLGLRF